MPLTEHLLDLDISFPCISFGYESWALDSYLKVLDDQIQHARDQYRLRAERELEGRKKELEHYEYGARLQEIDDAADAQIPRFFRIGAVVSIWGLFESFLTDFAVYVGKRENIGLSYKDIRGDNFRANVERYFEKVVRIPVPWSSEEREQLGQLYDLRNVLAHRNGHLMDLSPEGEEKIKKLVARMPGVSIDGSVVVVSPAYISAAATLVYTCVGRFGQQLADKYAQLVPAQTPNVSFHQERLNDKTSTTKT
jgi:hypothetical protein